MGERGASRALARSILPTILVASRRAADALISALVAPECIACDGPLESPLAGSICETCWRAIEPLASPGCPRCGVAVPVWRTVDCALCPRCRRSRGLVSRHAAAGAYAGTLRVAVHALKYDGRRSLAGRLGGLMRDAGRDVLAGADGVVPVPLHRTRLRARGFNQAKDLARAVGAPVAELLDRTRPTLPQAALPAARRHGNVRDAFAATSAMGAWRGATLVLVDDVRTTGATLEACARPLLAAGARDVRALTVAAAVPQRR